MEKRINVPDTAFHNYLKEAFGEEDIKDRLIALKIAPTKHKATRLLNGSDEWSAKELKKLAQALQIDWYWEFVEPYNVPTCIRIDEANSLRRHLGEVFQPVAVAS